MFLGVAIPAIIVGIIAWFYLKDRPADAKWLTDEEKTWLTAELSAEKTATEKTNNKGRIRDAFKSGRVWVLAGIYFGFIYGLYALAFFLPTIIAGFQEQFGTEFDVFQKGLITAIPYVPAAIALHFWARDASRRGLRTWHIVIPALAGAVSIPFALFAGSPVATIAVIAVTAMAIFSALPNFWTLPTQFLTGAAAAAGIALINTVGNLAGFSAPYITGAVADATKVGDEPQYVVPMFIVGGFMLLSAVLMLALSRTRKIKVGAATDDALDGAGDLPQQ
jgi:predicted MFS family arabinose efflux permease